MFYLQLNKTIFYNFICVFIQAYKTILAGITAVVAMFLQKNKIRKA